MGGVADIRAELEERIARESAAVAFLGELERFQRAREDHGFGIAAEIEPLAGGLLRVTLEVQCPAGMVDDPPALAVVEKGEAPKVAPPERMPAPAPAQAPFRRRPVTAEDDDEIVRMRLEGLSLDVICARLKRSKSTISERVNGQLAARIAAQTDEPRKNLPWSEDEDAQLVGLVGGGMTAAQAAREMGRPVAAVQFRCKKVLRERVRAARAAARAPAPKPVPAADAPDRAVEKLAWPPDLVAACGTELGHHLTRLYGPMPDADVVALDHKLVELLRGGHGAPAVAAEFDWDVADVVARWKALMAPFAVDGKAPLDAQRRVHEGLKVLAARVAA